MRHLRQIILSALLVSTLIALPQLASASNASLSYSGRLFDPSGDPYSGNIDVRAEVRSSGSCYLHRSQISTSTSAEGLFKIEMQDSGVAHIYTSGTGSDLQKVLSSTPSPSMFCFDASGNVTATPFTPSLQQAREIVISVSVNGAAFEEADVQAIKPYYQAYDSTALGGRPASDYLTGAAGDQTKLDGLFGSSGFANLLTYATNGNVAASGITITHTPTAANDVTNKGYTDSNIAGQATSGLGALAGGVDIGKVLQWNGSSWVAVASGVTDNTKLPLTGGTLSGDLRFSAGQSIEMPGASSISGVNSIYNTQFFTMAPTGYLIFSNRAAAPALSSAYKGAVWFNSAMDQVEVLTSAGTFSVLTTGSGISAAQITAGTLENARLGLTGGTIGADSLLMTNSTNTAIAPFKCTGFRTLGTDALGNWGCFASATGTVTNVGLSLPTDVFSASTGAITNSGTFGISFNQQLIGRVFSAPGGAASGVPVFRLLEPHDIPDISASKITAGLLGVDRGGTGLAPVSADAYKLYSLNSTGTVGVYATLSAGTGIDIDTSTAGTFKISATSPVASGTGVTSLTAGSGLLGGVITSSGTLQVDVGITNGKIVQVGIGDKIDAALLPIAAGANITITDNLGILTIAATAATGGTGGGTVTNVGLKAPTSVFTVSGSAVTGSGTFDISLNPQASAMVFASPTGPAGAPSFRSLASIDIPFLDMSKILTGTLAAGQGGTGLNSSSAAAGQLLIGNGAGFTLNTLVAGTGVSISNSPGSIDISFNPSTSGVVTSVGLSAPTSVFTVAGSAITGAGTLGLSLNSQTAAMVFASPTGSVGTPLFRALAATDIPSLDTSKIGSGLFSPSRGGTGLDGSAAATGTLLAGNGAGFTVRNLMAGAGITITNTTGSIVIASAAGGGTVTSVGLAAPTSIFTVSGSAVTGAGTLGLSLNSQTAAMVFAAPTGSPGAPLFRALAASDIPNLDASQIALGILNTARGGTGLNTSVATAGQLMIGNGAGFTLGALTAGTGVQISNAAGSINIAFNALTSGVVTNVGLTAPTSVFTVSGSAVTGAGTLGLSLNSQTAAMVFASPTGAAGAPLFRALATTDVPSLDASKIGSGTLSTARGGTGLNGAAAATGTILAGNGAGFTMRNLMAGAGITITNSTGSIVIASAAGGGTVTNVGLAAPTSVFTVSGSAVTGAGTLGLSLNSQTAAMVFASPTGAPGAPQFRALASVDIPFLDASKITSGSLGVSRGGTGLDGSTAGHGQLMIGNGTGFTLRTLAAGTGVAITNSAGSINIAFNPATSGVVTNVGLTAPTSVFTVSGSAVTGAGTLGLSLNSQTAAMIFASPTGSTGAPVFRSLASTDIPGLDAAKITTGTMATNRGGTGVNSSTAANGQMLIGTGTGLQLATLTAGTGISIFNSSGSINIASSGAAANSWIQGGNSFAQTGAFGTNDNYPLSFETNSGTRMTILANGNVGIGTASPGNAILALNGLTNTTSALLIPRATTAVRPAGMNGMLRYNTTLTKFEGFENGSWKNMIADSISIGLTTPSIFTTTGSPVTGTGTFEMALASQSAATIFAAPTGAAGAPAFRTLTSFDLPNLDASKITTGTLSLSRGGTGLDGSAAATGTILAGNGAGFTMRNLMAGAGISISNTTGSIVIATTGGAGTVTNVGLAAPTSVFTVSGSAVTGAGTLGLTLNLQTAGFVLAAPTGSTAAPSFRALTGYDIPNIDASKITSGTIAAARGGTGLNGSTATTGQILIGQTSGGFALRTLTAGSGMSISNTGSNVTLATTSGTSGFLQSGNSFGTTGIIGTNDSQAFAFETNGTERMRISATGQVGVGISPSAPFHVSSTDTGLASGYIVNTAAGGIGIWGTSTAATGGGIGVKGSATSASGVAVYAESTTSATALYATSTSGYAAIFNSGNVGIGDSAPSEKLVVGGNVKATAFISTSDRRLKTDIRTMSGIETVRQLRGVSYKWKANGDGDAGVIAQEVEEILPDAVRTDARGFKAVKYNYLIAPLIEATKELDVRCEARYNELTDKIRQLEEANRTLQQNNLDMEQRLLRLERAAGLNH